MQQSIGPQRLKTLLTPVIFRCRKTVNIFINRVLEHIASTSANGEHCFAFSALHRSIIGSIMRPSDGHAVARRFLSPPPSSFGGFSATPGVALFFCRNNGLTLGAASHKIRAFSRSRHEEDFLRQAPGRDPDRKSTRL